MPICAALLRAAWQSLRQAKRCKQRRWFTTLPIPANPGLIGFVITAQSLHLEASLQAAASRGLTLTIQ